MSYLREQHDYSDRHEDTLAGKDHELTLSTASIFGIFFGLIVLCGIFFGFGYSLGNHKTLGALPEQSAGAATSSNPNFSAFKPAPGQPAGIHADLPTPASAKPSIISDQVQATTVANPTASAPAQPITLPAPVARTTPPVTPARASTVATTAPAPATAGTFLVQVAAISVTHPDDAAMLQNALKAKGYAVTAHPAPDNFIHLLLGPFATRPAAEAMRERLAADGYTAYIK